VNGADSTSKLFGEAVDRICRRVSQVCTLSATVFLIIYWQDIAEKSKLFKTAQFTNTHIMIVSVFGSSLILALLVLNTLSLLNIMPDLCDLLQQLLLLISVVGLMVGAIVFNTKLLALYNTGTVNEERVQRIKKTRLVLHLGVVLMTLLIVLVALDSFFAYADNLWTQPWALVYPYAIISSQFIASAILVYAVKPIQPVRNANYTDSKEPIITNSQHHANKTVKGDENDTHHDALSSNSSAVSLRGVEGEGKKKNQKVGGESELATINPFFTYGR
jgi:hypothetical protein